MAISLVVSAAEGSPNSNGFVTGAINTTGCNLLVLGILDYNAVATTIVDSKSNTWTGLTTRPVNFSESRLYYCFNPTVGTGHTFTPSGLGMYPTICIAGFSGAVTSPFDVENGATGTSGTSKATGSVSPSENNELVITALCFDAINTAAINSGFTIMNQVNYVSGQHFGGAMAYLVQGSAAAVNPTWSWGTSTDHSTGIATFKSAVVAVPRFSALII